jgi:hypothetical protein
MLCTYLRAASVTDREMASSSRGGAIDFSSESRRKSFALPGPWSIRGLRLRSRRASGPFHYNWHA